MKQFTQPVIPGLRQQGAAQPNPPTDMPPIAPRRRPFRPHFMHLFRLVLTRSRPPCSLGCCYGDSVLPRSLPYPKGVFFGKLEPLVLAKSKSLVLAFPLGLHCVELRSAVGDQAGRLRRGRGRGRRRFLAMPAAALGSKDLCS
jgi:hypothetical protein